MFYFNRNENFSKIAENIEARVVIPLRMKRYIFKYLHTKCNKEKALNSKEICEMKRSIK